MKNLNTSLDNLKKEYREIFTVAVQEINEQVNKIKPAEIPNGNLFEQYEENSPGKNWQKEVLKLLNGEISREIFRKLNEILAYRTKFNCARCATCCKLACSEFSPEELKQKAQNGDNFAKQFTSIFVPYKSKEEAAKVYPEYIKLLEDNKEDKVYFYHCPKLTADNQCPDYENRPQICRDFPDNPLSILPLACGYNKWKEEIQPIALMLHAMIEIVEFYSDKLKKLI